MYPDGISRNAEAFDNSKVLEVFNLALYEKKSCAGVELKDNLLKEFKNFFVVKND